MTKRILICIFAVFIATVTIAQSCYKKGDDYTGLDISVYQSKLEEAACTLRDKFPNPYKSNFAVASYGTPKIPSFIGDQAEFHASFIANKFGVNDFYLLIVRSPENDRYALRLKLPTTGVFTCLNDDKLALIQVKLQNVFKAEFIKVGTNPADYYLIEIAAMKALGTIIEQVALGNCDILTKDEIFAFLYDKGFMPVPCKLKGLNTATSNPLGTFNVEVNDKTNLMIERIDEPNQNIAFKYLAEYIVDIIVKGGKVSKGYITNSISQFPEFEKEFGVNNFNVWWYLWDNPNQNEDDFFFIKRNDESKSFYAKPVGGCNPDWEKCPCYNFETQGEKSGIFFVFGTNQRQNWCLDYNTTCNDVQAIGGCQTSFQPNFISNIDYLSETLSSNKHKRWTLNKCFDWSVYNYTTNDVKDRQKAAMLLVDYVINNLPTDEKNDKTIPITLIGYSHGGNVAIQAAPMLFAVLEKKVNLITIATPASNFTTLGFNAPLFPNVKHPRFIENPNNPDVSSAINLHYHFWMEQDLTAGAGSWVLEGSHKEYFNSKTISFNLTNQKCSDDIWNFNSGIKKLDRHGFPYYLPCIKEKIDELLQDNQIIRQ